MTQDYSDLTEYKQSLIDVIKHLPKDSNKESTAFTSYLGSSSSDKVYPVILNFQTSLILQLIQKINNLEKIIIGTKRKTEEELEELTKVFGKLKVTNEEHIVTRKLPQTWIHWVP